MGILNASVIEGNGQAADTAPMDKFGIPTMINLIEDSPDHHYYFKYHHSAGDTMSVLDPDLLDGNVVGIASIFYLLADQQNTIPLLAAMMT